MASEMMIKDVSANFTGTAKLFKLDEAVEYTDEYDENHDPIKKETEYVVVSATNVPFSGPETYIFPADKEGNVLSWCELPGSFRGGLDIDEALANLRSVR